MTSDQNKLWTTLCSEMGGLVMLADSSQFVKLADSLADYYTALDIIRKTGDSYCDVCDQIATLVRAAFHAGRTLNHVHNLTAR